MASPLDKARYLNLATYRKNGTEVRTPVWFADEGDTYYLFSNNDAGKVKRLRNSPRAKVAACDVRGQLLGEWQDAQAVVLATTADDEHAHRALRRKYGWQMTLLDFFAGLSGRKRRRAYIALRLSSD